LVSPVQREMSVEHPKGYTGKCNPEVWDERAKPPQPRVKKVGQITEEQVRSRLTLTLEM